MPLKQNANLIFIDLNKEAALYTCDVFFSFFNMAIFNMLIYGKRRY